VNEENVMRMPGGSRGTSWPGNGNRIGAMKAALGRQLSEATSSTASSGQSSQTGVRPARNAAR